MGNTPSNGKDVPLVVAQRASETGVQVYFVKSHLYDADYVLYTLRCCYGSFEWNVSFRFSDISRLHSQIAADAHAAGLSPPSKTLRFHETRPSRLDERQRDVVHFTQTAACKNSLWVLQPVREFFQVGAISFRSEYGPKRMEGFVLTSTGKLSQSLFTGFRKRWLVMKDSFLAYFDSSTTDQPRGVIIFDSTVTVCISSRDSRELIVRSQDRQLFVRPIGKDANRLAKEWVRVLQEHLAQFRRASPVQAHQSFSPIRSDCRCIPYVCGREYMGAVAKAITNAKHTIFIADWRMNPDVLLTRYPDSEIVLKELLKQKAIQGVKVYVLLYREVSEKLQKKHRTMAIQNELMALHPDIQVLRHPDHISSRQFFWSHHDKIVVVDQQLAFVGGIDLTEGRFDDFMHRVAEIGYDYIDTSASNPDFSLGAEAVDMDSDGLAPSNLTKAPDVEGEIWPDVEYYNPNAPKDLVQEEIEEEGGILEVQTAYDGTEPPIAMAEVTAEATLASTGSIPALAASQPPSHCDAAMRHSTAMAEAMMVDDDLLEAKVQGKLLRSASDPLEVEEPASEPEHIPQATKAAAEADDGFEQEWKAHSFSLSVPLGIRVAEDCTVIRVEPGGQADVFGVSVDDVVKEVDGVRVGTLAEIEFQQHLARNDPSRSHITLHFQRTQFVQVAQQQQCQQPAMTSTGQLSSLGSGGAPPRGIDRFMVPRMPWQDIGVCVCGSAARDVALHFIQRWNHHRLALSDVAKPSLMPFSDSLHFPFPSADSDHADTTQVDLLANSLGILRLPNDGVAQGGQFIQGYDCDVQVVRSIGSWSLGAKTEQSIQHAWIEAIANAEHYVYIEQQYFISNMDEPEADPSTLHASSPFTQPPQSSTDVPSPPAHREAMTCEVVVPHGVGPGAIVAVQVPDGRRVHVKIPENAHPGQTVQIQVPPSPEPPQRPQSQRPTSSSGTSRRRSGLLDRAVSAVTSTMGILSQQSSFTAGVKNSIGFTLLQRLRRAILAREKFRVLVVMPLHPNGRFLDSVECKAVMEQQFNTIGRGERSLLGRLRDEFPFVNLDEYIVFTSLRAHGHMPMGPVSEQVYVHSKLLIVDDRKVIMGSANLNDRSMCGDRDSEIALVITDKSFYRTKMNGVDFSGGRLAHLLRVRLWREHLGMVPLEDEQRQVFAHSFASHVHSTESLTFWDDDITDPISDEVWNGIILRTAQDNTSFLEAAFDARPWNEIGTVAEAKQSLGLSRTSVHIDLSSSKWSEQVEQVKRNCEQVRGRLVLFPHSFLSEEKLEPSTALQLVIDRKLFQ